MILDRAKAPTCFTKQPDSHHECTPQNESRAVTRMIQKRIIVLQILVSIIIALGQDTNNDAVSSARKPGTRTLNPRPAMRLVDLKAADGTFLKASYFAAG